jgi:tetratricopeptide (TPR) repeat protein
MFKSALEIAQVTQTSQASWATTWLNLGTSLRKLGKLNDARDAYVKVLEIDSRSAPALGYLGLVYHLMDHLDDAIVKYHEVRIPLPFPSYFISAVAPLEVGHANIDIAIRSGNYFRPCPSTRSMHMFLSYSTSRSKRVLTLAHSHDSVGRAEARSGRVKCART